MPDFFLPVLSHFQNKNPWTASEGRMRCKVLPTLSEAPEESTLTAEVWEGPWAYEFSTVEEKQTFPLTAEGLDALRAWLTSWYETIQARPRRTLEEDIARKKN